ncbi:hypothetical protein CLV84_2916 [Neolewinella xylanilytica]|uniref:Uncharacterized protein n=1 Tax=Neolewinella xylanilytica TaxID=1514080 RepID=A0A2S6I4I4_9BACT|nr:hypothetical protein [Neolewinella xylanilytica]PPK85999.1 hypothetical protein CLV84_2916 [Neolewinella xylanilytica]
MRTLIKLILIMVVGLLAYNFFYGTLEEQEQSRLIVDKAKDLGSDAWNLLKTEREKMQQGKYDDALEELEDLYGTLRQEARELSNTDFTRELEKLTDRRSALEKTLDKGGELTDSAQRELKKLAKDTEDLMHEMEAKSQSGAPR